MTDDTHPYEAARALHRAGKLTQAEPLYLAALAAEAAHTDAMEWLGALYVQTGRFDQAVRWLEAAAKARPAIMRLHANLGAALGKAGRPVEAAAAFRAALALAPNDAGLHYALGVALHQAGADDDALPALRQAANLAPRSYDIRMILGHVLLELGYLAEAADSYRQAVERDPKRPQGHDGLGRALCAIQQPEAALEAFRRALACDPTFAMAEAGAGRAQAMLGRSNEARAALERALALDPKMPHYYLALLELAPFGEDDPHLHALEALARKAPAPDDKNRFELHFALFKAYDGLGRHREAFEQLRTGCMRKRSQAAYDEAATLTWFDTMASAFATLPPAPGMPTDRPVFVVGMPRSGTTLVEQIVASHPDAFGAGELTVLENLAHGLGAPPYDDAALRRLGETYLAQVGALAPQAKRIVDKLPANFLYLGLIRQALPGARIVHIRRDPLDTCFSCFATAFEKNNLLWSYDLGELGRYYRAYERLMAHWRNVLPPDAMLELRYEDIVGDFENQARRLIAFCGLDWNDCCLEFHRAKRAVATASFAQVRKPLYKSAIGRAGAYAPWLEPLRSALAADES